MIRYERFDITREKGFTKGATVTMVLGIIGAIFALIALIITLDLVIEINTLEEGMEGLGLAIGFAVLWPVSMVVGIICTVVVVISFAVSAKWYNKSAYVATLIPLCICAFFTLLTIIIPIIFI